LRLISHNATAEQERMGLRKSVAHRGRRKAGFAHRVADLVEAENDVACREKTWDAGRLMAVDPDATFVAAICAECDCEPRVDL
jgi:hypothetical protein